MNFISGIQATASALNAEQVRLDVVSQNIANAYTTKDAGGGPYQRKAVIFESLMGGLGSQSGGQGEKGVRVASIKPDETPGEMVYNPGHPHANADGMLRMPNVKLATEMVDLMSASRAYEANLTVARNARAMALKALSIGK
jgi:flagellar basal-body rod protein FlgC